MSRMDLDDSGGTLMEVRIHSPQGGSWEREIRELPGVTRVEPLGVPGTSARLRVIHLHSPFLPLFRELQLMHRFPFPVERGIATWVLVGPEARVRRFVQEVRRRHPESIIESVRHDDPDGEGVLTPRQREVFRRALNAGYFEVPRKTTLTNLAKELGLAISSLSETLAIIERKLILARQGE